MDIEEKKSLTSSWFRELRDMFCEEFADIDGGSFERKNWDHKFEGGGEMSLMKGEVFEKVGVNISTVSGKFDNDFKSEVKGTEERLTTGQVALVLWHTCNHPKYRHFTLIRDI
jgi:coproporphyrinogen III oxidase